jgi:DNA-binding MarR family transcriptional regulator
MAVRQNWDLRLGFLIHDVSRLRRMMLDRALTPLGITRSQWWVLAFISRQDGLSQTELADELDVSKVGLGTLLDRLQSSGFITRRPDATDRRVKRVFLTAQAQGLLRSIRAETDKQNEKIAKGISHTALRLTSDTLLAMKHNLRALSDQSGSVSGSAKSESRQPLIGKKKKPKTKRSRSSRPIASLAEA